MSADRCILPGGRIIAHRLCLFLGRVHEMRDRAGPGPVLLVGHSYGGAVITASGVADNVAGPVYVAGMAPGEVEVLAECQSRFPAAVVETRKRRS